MMETSHQTDITELKNQLSDSQRRVYETLIRKRLPENVKLKNVGEMQLTNDQTRLWVVSQLNNVSHILNLSSAYRLDDDIDIQRLQDAIRHVSKVQAMLGAFVDGNHSPPVLKFSDNIHVPLTVINCEATAIDDTILRESQCVFDLSTPPLCKCSLLKTQHYSILVVVMHHMIADGISQDLFIDQVVRSYSGENIQLDSNFHDYQHWLEEERSGPQFDKQKSFWKNNLNGVPTELTLPFDKQRPQTSSHHGNTNNYQISSTIYNRLKSLINDSGHTEFSTLLAIYGVTLSKLCRQNDFVIGVPTASRLQHNISKSIGFFANTSVIRFNFNSDSITQKTLDEVQYSVDNCFDNPLLGLADIISIVNPPRTGNYTPLVQVMFSFLPKPETKTLGSVALQQITIKSDTAEFDLFCVARENCSGGLDLQFQYNSELFESNTIDTIFNTFTKTLDRLLPGEVQIAPDRKASTSIEKLVLPIASNFTIDPVLPALNYLIQETELQVEPEVAAYDQIHQQLIHKGSSFHQSTLGGVLIINIEKWIDGNFDNRMSELTKAVSSLYLSGARLTAILSTKESPSLPSCDLLRIQSAEKILSELADQYQFDFIHGSATTLPTPVVTYYDEISHRLADIPYTPVYYAALAESIASACFKRLFSPYKVIVVDCDNTLWAGACGDLGPDGLVIDDAHIALQKQLIKCQESGALICLASKNSQDSVDQVFSTNSDMLLQGNHIVARKINWESKSENISQLADELNLGLDSFLFIDDNPTEISDVSRNCPEVTCLLYPEELSKRRRFAQHNWLFNFCSSSDVDKQRTQLYRDNIQRKKIEYECQSLEEFITTLNVNVDIVSLENTHIQRAAQLSYRTNQFNATSIRRDEDDFLKIIEDDNFFCFLVSVNDKYGDYGDVGIIVLERCDQHLSVETFVLSCRVLGRAVETRMAIFIGEFGVRNGYKDIVFHTTSTIKNEPLRRFYDSAFSNGEKYQYEGSKQYPISAERLASIPMIIESGQKTKPQKELTQRRINQARYQDLIGILGQPDKIMELSKQTLKTKNTVSSVNNSYAANNEELIAHSLQSLSTSVRKPTFERFPVDNSVPNLGKHIANPIMEENILSVWQDTLAERDIDKTANFFDIGGTSVLMVQVNAELKRQFDVDVSMVDLFKYPSISGLAKYICDSSTNAVMTEFSTSRGTKQRQLLQRTLKRKVR